MYHFTRVIIDIRLNIHYKHTIDYCSSSGQRRQQIKQIKTGLNLGGIRKNIDAHLFYTSVLNVNYD